MHRAVRAHARQGAVELRDSDRTAPRDGDDVATAALDPSRDWPEDAAPAGDELPDGVRIDERCVARPGLDELEQPLGEAGENRLHARGHRAGDRLGALALANGTRDLAAKIGERRERGSPRLSTTAWSVPRYGSLRSAPADAARTGLIEAIVRCQGRTLAASNREAGLT